MPQAPSDNFDAFEPTFPPSRDVAYLKWVEQLRALSTSEVSIRRAAPTGEDGLRVRDIQILCAPITVLPVSKNVTTIAAETVLLAQIDDVHVGYCHIASVRRDSAPMFVRVVAVTPAAQRRGVGLALLTTAAGLQPRHDIALATQDGNAAARAMNEKFAELIGASIRRVSLGTYRNSDLGIRRGDGYRVWLIERAPLRRDS